MENILLYFLVLLIPAIASINVTNAFNKYKKVDNSKKLSGFEVARKILDENGLNDLYIVELRSDSGDHYDPNQKVIRLSTPVFHGESVMSAAVAAHECGHAIQDKEEYQFFNIRAMICPFVNFITYMAYILFLVSIFLQAIDMLMIAIAVIFISLIFQFVTLPVEFDASRRAMEELKKYDLLDASELEGADKVLKAAALTYVASLLSSILNLIRLIIINSSRRD